MFFRRFVLLIYKSTAVMNGLEFLIPIVMFSGAFLMVWGIRYLQNKENMAMIERGMDPKTRRRQRDADPSQTLKNGFLFVGAGIGLLLSVLITKSLHLEGSERNAVFFGLIALFGGTGMILDYLYERKNPPTWPGE
jgi:hypothetical protein